MTHDEPGESPGKVGASAGHATRCDIDFKGVMSGLGHWAVDLAPSIASSSS